MEACLEPGNPDTRHPHREASAMNTIVDYSYTDAHNYS